MKLKTHLFGRRSTSSGASVTFLFDFGATINTYLLAYETGCMTKPIVSPPGILLFSALSSCHYITRAKVCLLSVIITSMRLGRQSLPMRKFRRVGQNSPAVLSRFWTKVRQIWQHVGASPCRLTSFLLLICSVAEICSLKVQSRSKNRFCPSPWGGG